MIKIEKGKMISEGDTTELMTDLTMIQRILWKEEILSKELIEETHKLYSKSRAEIILETLDSIMKNLEEMGKKLDEN